MSIWSSFCTFGHIGPTPEIRDRETGDVLAPAGTEPQLDDRPYLGYEIPGTGPPRTLLPGELLTEQTDPALAATVPRGGFVDLANTWYEAALVRLSVEDEQQHEVELYLHVDQVRQLRDRLNDFLEDRRRFLAGDTAAVRHYPHDPR